MTTTNIEWTAIVNDDGMVTKGKVWNPVTGCTKVSAGCKHCYAEVIANRFWQTQYEPNEDGSPRKFTDIRLHYDRLEQPLAWRDPKMCFVNSMSDLFHEKVPFDFILRVWMIMAQTDHIYQILTKRPERMYRFVKDWLPGAWGLATTTLRLLEDPLPNVWLGVSCENQQAADERIPWLLKTPAAVRFVSAEPLLGAIDLSSYLGFVPTELWSTMTIVSAKQWLREHNWLDWIIVGGESGTGARPMDLQWARDIRDQCQTAGVAFFMKQIGGSRHKGGNLEDLPEDLRIREYPTKEGEHVHVS